MSRWRRKSFRRRAAAGIIILALLAGAYWLGRQQGGLPGGAGSLYGDRESDTLILHPHIPEMGMDIARWRPDGPSPQHPWVAIIIDDFGQSASLKIAPDFLGLPFPVTLSVIPGNPSSAAIARLTREAGRELFIHLPMEPERRVSMGERYMVMTGMGGAELRRILDSASGEVAGATGLNNHMGSRATADSALMRELAAELKQRGLIFLDSRTGFNSCAWRVMTGGDVPALWRDVFLDNERDTSHIAGQIARLLRVAKARGWAVGIGHSHPQTLAMLRRLIPRLTAEGVKVTTLGELAARVAGMRREAMAQNIITN